MNDCEILSSSYSSLPPPLHCPDVLAQNSPVAYSYLKSHHLWTEPPYAQVWQLHPKQVHNYLDLPALLHTDLIKLSYGFQGTFAGKHCVYYEFLKGLVYLCRIKRWRVWTQCRNEKLPLSFFQINQLLAMPWSATELVQLYRPRIETVS